MRSLPSSARVATALFCLAIVPSTADSPSSTLFYRLSPGQTLRYRLQADIKAHMPLFDSPTPSDLDATIKVVYLATPKTLTADGTADVELKVDTAQLLIGAGKDQFEFPVPIEDVQKVLDQTITLTRTGEVKRAAGMEKPPFAVSVPGVDPRRLYALLFPIVFQSRPVKPGDTWSFKSELLNGEGADPRFSVTILPTEPGKPSSGIANGSRKLPGVSILTMREQFDMKVNVALDEENKPAPAGSTPYRTRKGSISGSGDLKFDPSSGLFTRSVVDIRANILEELLGEPRSKEEPRSIKSRVKARVVVEQLKSAEKSADAKDAGHSIP